MFLVNLLEDFEGFLVETLSRQKLKQFEREREKMQALKSSLEYRQTDLIYLVKEDYEYKKRGDKWTKVENFTHGKYPGRYKFTIKFPNDYPKSYPIIYCKPLHSRDISPHIMNERGGICIASQKHGKPNTYWNSNMNAKGALMLAKHLITDEINAPKMAEVKRAKRKTKSIKNTVFEELSKIMSVKTFNNEFAKAKRLKIGDDWKWNEIAYKFAECSVNAKKDVLRFYSRKTQQKKVKNNEVNKSERTRRRRR